MNLLSDVDGFKLLQQAGAAGIKKSVLLIIDFFDDKQNPDDLSYLEWVHEFHYDILKKHSDKVMVFSGLDPRRGRKGLDLLEKAIKLYGFKGLKLYPPCGFELDDPEVLPYYEMCGDYQIPLLTHTGPSLGGMKLSENYPNSILKVAKSFKNVRFILAHAGILRFDEGISIAKARENVFLDISGFQKEMNFKDNIEAKLKELFQTIPEKILFGTDWPLFNFNTPQNVWINRLLQLECISDDQKDKLLFNNAKAILGDV